MQEITTLNIGLLYGTDTGNTEEAGNQISDAFVEYGVAVEMMNIMDASKVVIEGFDVIIMGIPTWDFGGIQSEWENSEAAILDCNLEGKTVALYGLGDQDGYPEYFLDAMGWLNERVRYVGATVVGAWSTEGYTFEKSWAANEDKTLFCGLGLDEDMQMEQTDQRIKDWVEQIVGEIALAD